jgi:hypothetical protein
MAVADVPLDSNVEVLGLLIDAPLIVLFQLHQRPPDVLEACECRVEPTSSNNQVTDTS